MHAVGDTHVQEVGIGEVGQDAAVHPRVAENGQVPEMVEAGVSVGIWGTARAAG